MRKLLQKYQNGNYNVKIYNDGSKVRIGKELPFVADFPENIDIKITDYCDAGCPFCHENSTVEGKHAENINSHPFLGTLRPGTELAIGGGNPLNHPNLELFLKRMMMLGIICNLTVNSKHLTFEVQAMLEKWIVIGLVKGVGISVNNFHEGAYQFARRRPTVVLHVINGVMTQSELEKYYHHDVRILLLGYKVFGRGELVYNPQVEEKKRIMSESLYEILNKFHTVSFDNLGIDQLQPQRFMSESEWGQFYMGDDGRHTMYIDLVKQQYAMSSTATERYPLANTIDEMFAVVQSIAERKKANEPDRIPDGTVEERT